jgi:hypothetical protein
MTADIGMFPNLVTERPIPMPVHREGGWYDDFYTTGMKDPLYSITGTRSANGLAVRGVAPSAGSVFVAELPVLARAVNFEAELTMRRVVGGDTGFRFRYLDSSNYMRIVFTSTEIGLSQVVAGAFTTVWSQAFTTTDYHRVAFKVHGPRYEVWVDNKMYFSGTNTTNMAAGNTRMMLYAFDGTLQASSDFQYLAIKHL